MMFQNLLRALFHLPESAYHNRRRIIPVQRPEIQTLEDRLAPAVVGTLSLEGNYMMYTGTSANNIVMISGTNSHFSITDAAGTITNSTGVPALTTPAGGAIPSQVTSIIVNTGSGVDTVMLTGLNTTRSLQVSSEFITVTGGLTAGAITFINSPGGLTTLNAGQISSVANVNAGAMYFDGPVNLGAGTETLFTDGVTDGDVLFYSTITEPGNLQMNPAGRPAPENSGSSLGVLGMTVGSMQVGSTAGANGLPGANNITFYKSVTTNGTIAVGGYGNPRCSEQRSHYRRQRPFHRLH